ncbi:DUF2312 domain-containing protein [Methyloceanibacter caenitepidi]|uniref:UPF0335 protein GL4_2907 n=1 Tax=Methyloceanibacter caenitepidi TaxID=1384459 RepID=A0A0A8K604_9HYPH|nr:DUF2312 domain-containing protein [Methyloceanibacter caenitepidi]BAQ18340.1 uncharacterized protein conserved in bacteria [Methyloceanibacter caenitepidi]
MTILQTSAKEQLRAFVSRIERLEEEKAALSADLKEVYAEAKSTGFDVKALRKLVSMRKADEHKRLEEEAILATYMHALGMQADLFDDADAAEDDHTEHRAEPAALAEATV